MTRTDSSKPRGAGGGRWRRRELLLAGTGLLLLAQVPALRAESATAVTQLRLVRESDGLYVFASIRLDLPPAVEDALVKGVPMYFLAEAEVTRHRWYWSDKQVTLAQRHMRLAFHPLTRRWRLNVSSGLLTASSLAQSLALNFDTQEEALAALQRISGWKVADAAQMDADAAHKVELRFALDLGQLPRPFQIGALGQSEWNLSATATRQLGAAQKQSD